MGEGRLKIKLNKVFYRREAIEEALRDFKEVLSGSIVNDGFEVEITPKEAIPNLEYEFSNYVLGLMKNNQMI